MQPVERMGMDIEIGFQSGQAGIMLVKLKCLQIFSIHIDQRIPA